jgi:hypothetical protein
MESTSPTQVDDRIHVVVAEELKDYVDHSLCQAYRTDIEKDNHALEVRIASVEKRLWWIISLQFTVLVAVIAELVKAAGK